MSVHNMRELEEQNVCSNCVGEPYLAEMIKVDDHSAVCVCDYCGGTLPTVMLDWLAERCRSVFENFYESTADDDKVVYYDRDPDGDSLDTCLGDLLPDAAEDLVDDLSKLMLYQQGREDYDSDDPYYIRSKRLNIYFSSNWRRMSESLRTEARLCNPIVFQILDEMFGPVAYDATADGRPVVVLAGPGRALSSLHRARVCQGMEELRKCIAYPEAELGPHAIGKGRAGRMNATGVSVFYGATHEAVARAEVRPPVGSKVLIGQFEIIRPLRLLDLNALSKIRIDSSLSLFDETAVKQIGRRDFLAQLCEKLVMPVMPQDEESSYLITQAIADYLAMHEDLAIDGIIFSSAQASKSAGGKNVVLFHKAARVLKADKDLHKSRDASVMDEDEAGPNLRPRMWVEEEKEVFASLGPFEPDQRKTTLRLNLESLAVHTIDAVSIEAAVHSVEIIRGGMDNFEF